MSITYHKLQPHQTQQYRAIRLESLQAHPDNFGSTYEDESVKPKLGYEDYIEQQPDDRFIVGAFDGEILIGICGFFGDNTKKNIHKGAIIQMYVRKAYTGKGIGLALLNATVDVAFEIPRIEQLVLGVIADNMAAIKTYERAGFKQFGFHKNYFKEGNIYLDQVFMILYKEEVI